MRVCRVMKSRALPPRSNLNADGATEDDDVPIVRGDPISKKKKSGSGIDLGLAIGVLIAAVILAFCCGAVRSPRP